MPKPYNCTCEITEFIGWIRREKDRLAVLCGSGISTRSGAPTASELVKKILDAVGGTGDLRKHWGADAGLPDRVPLRFEGLLEVLQRTVDPRLTLVDRLYFDATGSGLVPNEMHRCIARIARDRPVVTTNFDVLAENAMRASDWPDWHRSVRASAKDWQTWDWECGGGRDLAGLWKIHGTVRAFDGNRDEWVASGDAEPAATLKSISRTRKDENRKQFVRRLLEERPLLVVGYSGWDDFDVSSWLGEFCWRHPVYWIAYDGTGEVGRLLRNARHQRGRQRNLFVLDCKKCNAAVNSVLQCIAGSNGLLKQAYGPGHPNSWELRFSEWARQHLESGWQKQFLTAELWKHLGRFDKAIETLKGAQWDANPDAILEGRRSLLLAEAEVETGRKWDRERAKEHAEQALDLCRFGIECHAARIAYAKTLELAPNPDRQTAGRILRGVFDTAENPFDKGRAAAELLRLGEHTGTQWLDPAVELAEIRKGDLYVEALVHHEEAKTEWTKASCQSDVRRAIHYLGEAERLRRNLGDVRGLCATTNTLGAFYQSWIDWRPRNLRHGTTKPAQLARCYHEYSLRLARRHKLRFDQHAALVGLAICDLRHGSLSRGIANAKKAIAEAHKLMEGRQELEKFRFEYSELLVCTASARSLRAAQEQSQRGFANLATKRLDNARDTRLLHLVARARFNADISGFWLNRSREVGRISISKYREIETVPYWRHLARHAVTTACGAQTARDWARLLLHPLSPLPR